MDTSNLVSNALRYYDENQEKYMRHFRKVAYVSFFHRKSDMSRDIVYMYDRLHSTSLSIYYQQIKGEMTGDLLKTSSGFCLNGTRNIFLKSNFSNI